MKVRKAVIPVAGLGTRFLPATKATPKEMLAIVDKPALQYIVEEAAASGIESILFVTNRGKTAIENHFDHNIELELALREKGKMEALRQVEAINHFCDIFYVRQNETLGLGHAILCAKDFIGDEPFAILLGDDMVWNPEDPCIGQLMRQYEKTGASIIGCQSVDPAVIDKYGCIDGENVGEGLYRIRTMVEKPKREEAPSNVAILGRHVLSPHIFQYLEKTQPGYGGEIQLTDALRDMAREEAVFGYDFTGRRYDIGDKQGFLEATVEFALRDPALRDRFHAYLEQLIQSEN
uniref:UTP--glucose-1-phosphate uridylyltransferase GalU n=1 Tax=Ndongobacter massiliensis TaxID=1871025 RepID=UPI000930AD88|nr:UTP--glucose-1-phosphate uridylyltransferase GalU [Ndongobacter massiliensis]